MHRNGPREFSASVRTQFSVVVSTMLGRRPGVRNGPPATQASTATEPSSVSTSANSCSTERSSDDIDLERAMAISERIGNTARAANIEVGHCDRKSIARKCAGSRLADAAGCPGYNRDPLHTRPPELP